MNAIEPQTWQAESSARTLAQFWDAERRRGVCSTRGMSNSTDAVLLALLLDLAISLAPVEEDEDAAVAEKHDRVSRVKTADPHTGLFHCVAAILSLWMEARVTLAEHDERQTLRAVLHRREALLWQPRAWLPTEWSHLHDDTTSARLVEAALMEAVGPGAVPAGLSPGSAAWFVWMVDTCLSCIEANNTVSTTATGPYRSDGAACTSLLRVLHDVFGRSDETSACDVAPAAAFPVSSVVVSTSFLGALFAVRARSLHQVALWFAETCLSRSTHGTETLMGVYTRLLVSASDSATIAYEQFDEESVLAMRQTIQSELQTVTSTTGLPGSSTARSLVVAVHPSVHVSRLGCRVVSGVGLVASAPIAEGECVFAEAPMAAYTRGDLVSGDDVMRCLEEKVMCSRTAGQPLLPCLHETFARLAQLAAWAGALPSPGPTIPTAGSPTESGAQRVTATLVAPGHHLVQSITDLDTFKIGLSCEDELGADTKDANAWCYLRGIDTGKGIGYLTSLLNHSCSPNALLVTLSTRPSSSASPSCASSESENLFAVVALRPIEAGEEITISYLPSSSLVSRAEKTKALGFVCECGFCASRAYLLEGIQCGECGHLLRPSGAVDSGDTGHAVNCPAHSTPFAQWHDAIVLPLVRQIDQAEALVGDGAEEGVGHGADADDGDVWTNAVRHLVRLDEQLQVRDAPLLPVHYVRLRMREHLLAIAVGASGLTLGLSESLQQIAAELVESVELLVPGNTPLLTDLRMHYVFVRSRHLHDVLEADGAADADPSLGHGGDCCGAVREEAAVLRKPYVRDPVVRHCVIRSFQEHHVQCVGWRASLSHVIGASLTPCQPLETFLARFPVELGAAGLESVADMDMLACMDDGEQETAVNACA